MKIGIIGTGNMGRILTEAMLDGNAVSPSSLTVTNRTLGKAYELQKSYQEIHVGDTRETVETSDAIFICVKPHDVYTVIKDIQPYLSKDKCLISITSPINTGQIESVANCSVARIIPSITNRALAGVSLMTFGENCSKQWRDRLWSLFEKISVPLEINEDVTRVSSDIVSCGPAFFSYLAQRFVAAAVKETRIDLETATELTSEMLIGLGELLSKKHYTLPALQEKVCVKGGITGEGIKVLEQELGDVFEHLFQATHLKFEEDLSNTRAHFSQ